MSHWLVGVDTGGTFTDLIAIDPASGVIKRAKVPSVPGDPSLAVLDALENLFGNSFPPLRAARRLGIAAVDRIGPLKRAFARQAMGLG